MDLVLRGPDLLKLTSKGEMGGGGFADLIALLIRTLHVIIVDERERQHWATFSLDTAWQATEQAGSPCEKVEPIFTFLFP